MSRNVAITEWATLLEAIRGTLEKRWPWLRIEVEKGDRLTVEAPGESHGSGIHGTLDLGLGRGFHGMEVAARMAAGVSLGNTLDDAARALADAGAVLDALTVARSMAGDLHIYPDALLPCRECSGNGKQWLGRGKDRREVVCPRCEGSKLEPQAAPTEGGAT